MSTGTKPIVLIHGLWMTPRSWDPFRQFFEDHGHQVFTPVWPRMNGEVEEIRRNPYGLAGLGVTEIADYYDQFVRALDTPPIIMGHSFGGLIVQMLLDRGLGAVGIAIDSVAPKGVFRLPFTQLKAASPVLRNPFNVKRVVGLTFKQFQYAFANTMSEAEARAAYDHNAIPGPGRPLFQAAFANMNPWAATKVNYHNNTRAPLLLIAGEKDHTVPSIVGQIIYEKYSHSSAVTAFKEFPNRSHLIIGQHGWEAVAHYALMWAGEQLQKR